MPSVLLFVAIVPPHDFTRIEMRVEHVDEVLRSADVVEIALCCPFEDQGASEIFFVDRGNIDEGVAHAPR